MLSFTSPAWLGECALLNWGSPETRMHYGKKSRVRAVLAAKEGPTQRS